MLELENLSKSYRGIPAISNVNFRVNAGEVVGYLGANGSGKSTTVKIITGLLQPNEGRVLFQGRNIRDDLVGFRAALGYVPEEAHLYNYLSGMEYLQLVGRLRGMRERQIQLKAHRLLQLLGLESWRHSPISMYSKGMKQRVLIAAALRRDAHELITHVIGNEELGRLNVVIVASRPTQSERIPITFEFSIRLVKMANHRFRCSCWPELRLAVLHDYAAGVVIFGVVNATAVTPRPSD